MATNEAGTSALPYVLVDALTEDVLLLGSSIDARLVSISTGRVLVSLKYASPEAAARCSTCVQLTGESRALDCLVALVGDDKQLNVYRVTITGAATTLTKVWTRSLPKRAVKMEWEAESDAERRLIVGDRHGDVRSFIVPTESTQEGSERSELPSAKRVQLEGSGSGIQAHGTTAGQEDDEDDDAEDGTLHVGHVSYLTDFVLSSFSSHAPTHPQQYIITADRDEHIRISRWGKRRAGFIALRYLLGSTEAVGALCTVEGVALKRIQSLGGLSESARDMCKHALLISCDGSRLRIWSLRPDSERDSARNDLQAAFDVEQAVQKYCMIDSGKERRRERLFGKGKGSVKRNADGAPVLDDGPQHVASYTPIITRLAVFDDGECVYLLFALDGAKAVFSVPLATLLQSTNDEEVNAHIVATDVGFPIASLKFQHQSGGPAIWLTLDVRDEMVPAGETPKLLCLLNWDSTARAFVKAENDRLPILQQQQTLLAQRGHADLASSLILYDALTLFTKQEFEKTEGLEAISEGGLIKGGLANYEIPGRPASKSNKQNSEWATRRREKAREVMKQRIEARLAALAPNGAAEKEESAGAST